MSTSKDFEEFKVMYREDIRDIEMPFSIMRLPIERGYPVPWFVAEVNGKFDFRIANPMKKLEAMTDKVCWICGQKLGSKFTFVLGPMCLINKINSEPPSHHECATYAVKACPFLIQKQYKYNEANLPDNVQNPGGIAIKRQPGATCLYETNNYTFFNDGEGILFEVGDLISLEWWTKGRRSTYEEAKQSIDTGLPILEDILKRDIEEAKFTVEKLRLRKEFDDNVRRAYDLLPGKQFKKSMLGSAAKRFQKI